MPYDAITADSNIFISNGLKLESGLLALFQQFATSPVDLILSEIVIREVHRHLKDAAQSVSDRLTNAIVSSAEHGLVSAETTAELVELTAATMAPGDAARARLQKFLEASAGTVIKADTADMKRLIKLYFSVDPPFEGRKKHEFPDAIALISLEQWAAENAKRVLAVSQDKGWAAFADTSEWIDVEPELPKALQVLQGHLDQAREVISRWLVNVDKGDNEVWRQLESDVSDQVSDLQPHIEAASGYYYEADLVELTFHELELARADDGPEIEFDILQIGANKVVVRVPIHVSAEVSADFSFKAFDSIDHDYVPLGSGNVVEEVAFDAAVLITLDGDLDADLSQLDVSRVELVEAAAWVDVGEIGPDYPDEPEYYRE